MISVNRARPVRRPPPRVESDERARVHLPVIPWIDIAPSLPEPLVQPSAAPVVPPPGDPFNPHKILNHFDRLQRLVQGDLVFPITVEIDPTNVCNHRCPWCVSMESHTGESLEFATFQKLIDELRQCDVRSIVLKGGGEPTVHPRFIDMLDVLQQAGFSVGLITNGSMPRPGSAEKILECCQWVRVSLDAATAQTHHKIHGTRDFNKIVQNVAYLTGHTRQTMVGLNFVTEAANAHEMVQFAELGQSLGVAYVSIRCVFDPANPLLEDLRAAMRQQALAAKRLETASFRVFLGNFTDRYLNADRSEPFPYRRCLGPNLIGIVGGDGDVYACCFLRGNKKFSFGNIAHQSFRDIWTSDRRQEVMQSIYRGECARACAGGMTANRYNTYNEILNYLSAEEKMHADFA